VRRFARLGYDCLGDLRRGSLVLFRSSADLREQVIRLGCLEPLLRDLEPVLCKSSPERIVFDPVNDLLAGRNQKDVVARTTELSAWLRSFGATVVLVANGESPWVIESLIPSVRESFRFGVKENKDRVVRFIAFEKSPQIADQAVRVDPSRGISLLKDQTTREMFFQEPATNDVTTVSSEPGAVQVAGASNLDEVVSFEQWESEDLLRAEASEQARDEFFAMLDELQSFASSPDMDIVETEPSGGINGRHSNRGTSSMEIA
jgi:hypothetical protein